MYTEVTIAGTGDESAMALGTEVFDLIEQGHTQVTVTCTDELVWDYIHPTTQVRQEVMGRTYRLEWSS